MLRIIAPLLVALAPAAAVGQNPLFAQVGDPLPDGMGQLIAAADFENDGDVDLFSTVGVFLNTNGFFSPGPVLGSAALDPASNVRSIAVADFTGDARADVLIGRGGGTPSGLILMAAPPPGGTTFVMAAVFTGATDFLELAAADFDGDFDVDVVAATISATTPVWQLFRNDGIGTFTAAPAVVWPAAPVTGLWTGAGDFDNDGWTDVYLTTGNGVEIWRRNLGGLGFGPSQTLPSTLVTAGGAIGDFDGDGDDDVYVCDVAGVEAVHPGSPSGLMAGPQSFFGVLGPPPIAGDFDGDGDAELLRSVLDVQGGFDGALSIRFGSPSGLGFATPAGPVSFYYTAPRPYPGAAFGDVDGDGDLDAAIVAGRAAPALVINGGASGAAIVPQTIPPGFGRLLCAPGDIDGDGDPDLLRAVGSGPTTVYAARNDGRGNFGPPSAVGAHPGVPGRGTLEDLDLDGDLDLWVGSLFATGADVAMLNDGAGTFTAGPTVANTLTFVLATGDVDGDLDLDVIAGRSFTGFPPVFYAPVLIRSLLGPGGLAFAAPVPIGGAQWVTDIELFDAEPDGDLDLLFGTSSVPPFGTAKIYVNDGLGGFSPGPTFPGATSFFVAAGDLNGDGVVDLVLGNRTWLGGPGGYTLFGTHLGPNGKVDLMDLDEDGDLDLVDSSGAWYAGDGVGNFGPPLLFVSYTPVTTFGLDPVPFDADSDGDLDVIVEGEGHPAHLSIYRNLTRQAGRTSLMSQSSFASFAIYGAPLDPWALAASAPGALPLPLPPLGTLFLDVPSIVVAGTGSISANGRSDVVGFISAAPGLAGLTLSWQALVGVRLTNGFDATVLP